MHVSEKLKKIFVLQDRIVWILNSLIC